MARTALKKSRKLSTAKKEARMADKIRKEVMESPEVQAYYEGARFDWFKRSYIPHGIQDVRYDADASTRLELLRKSRYFKCNNAIYNKLCSVFVQYVVGHNGLQAIPNSQEEDWNEASTEWWRAWSQCCDLGSDQPLSALQNTAATVWFVDGECFFYKTFSENTLRPEPRIQLIEAHRIATPSDLKTYGGNEIIDGIEITKAGTRVAYWLAKNPVTEASTGKYGITIMPGFGAYQGTSENFDRIPADQMLHLFKAERPGQLRGIPFCYPIVNDVHDLDDLAIYEMQAAKSAAKVQNVVTTGTGEANTTGMRRANIIRQSQNASGAVVQKQSGNFYDSQTAGDRYLRPGEKMEQFASERPSVTTQWFYDYTVRKICAGIGISALLVLPFSLQGTVVRLDADCGAGFFRKHTSIAAAIIRQLYGWALEWAKDYDRKMDGAPADFAAVTVRPPRSSNVDIGRNSQAMLSEYQAGVRTAADICAEAGHDYRHVFEQKAKEAALARKLAKKYGCTPQEIVSFSAPDLQPAPVQEQATPDNGTSSPAEEKPKPRTRAVVKV